MMMRNVFRVISAAVVLGITVTLLPYGASAQDIFGNAAAGSKRKGARKPTQITSESLDADIAKNTIIFTGDVFVDDDDITIKCHKLTIFLEEKDQGDAGMKDKKEKAMPTGSDDIKSKKEPVRIVCEEDVVVVRKVYDPLEKAKGDQKATGGKAVYDIKSGTIELTENNPTITRGEEVIAADKITMWREQQRAKFEGNVKTSFKSAFESGESKPSSETVPAEAPAASTQTIQPSQVEEQNTGDQDQKTKRKVYTGRIEKTEDAESAAPVNKVDVRSIIVTDPPEQK